jgi:hypothetical protein
MNGRRLTRLLCVAISNALLFAGAVRLMPHELLWLLGTLLCAGCVAGLVLEIALRKWAALFNIGLPAIVTAVMASSIVWMPALAFLQHDQYPAEAGEAAGFLLLFSGYPLCLTIIIGLAYRLIDVTPDRTVTSLGLR